MLEIYGSQCEIQNTIQNTINQNKKSGIVCKIKEYHASFYITLPTTTQPSSKVNDINQYF